MRAIDHETRRLDAIERGEPPPPAPAPILLPPPADVPTSSLEAKPPSELLTPVPLPGRDRRRLPRKPKAAAPRPPATPPFVNPPAPVTSQQQVAPLPPAIDVRPAPGAAKPRPRPPLALTPQVANPPPRPALQNSN